MQTRLNTHTHIQIYSKHIMNLGLPYFGAEDFCAYDDGAPCKRWRLRCWLLWR